MFQALEDFHRACRNQLIELTIGAGESLIQWLLLPRLGQLVKRRTKLNIKLQNLRTKDILNGLDDGRLDFGVIGESSTNSKLETILLGKMDYALFVPLQLMPANPPESKSPLFLLDNLPLAVLDGSPSILEAIESTASRHKLTLNIRLQLSSYPQLVQAVQSLQVASVMPTMAAKSLPKDAYQLVRLPFLDRLSRKIFLAWNRDVAKVRQTKASFAPVLGECFKH